MPLQPTREDVPLGRIADKPVPGLAVVFDGQPTLRIAPFVQEELRMGRSAENHLSLTEDRVSREHAVVRLKKGHWEIADLDSRNGTFLNGEPVRGSVAMASGDIVRLGQSVLLAVEDLRRLEGGVEVRDGRVCGPRLRSAQAQIQEAAKAGKDLLLIGESGTGKEFAAQLFHRAGPLSLGPWVPVNCAAIPAGLAERLLFGARRGAFTGANAEANGYFQEANGGVLFLDEVGELEPPVQAKLLRVLETREVLPIGATRVVKVHTQICFATHRNVAQPETEAPFRRDLYYRISNCMVRLPPLRERPEEIPWLLEAAVKRSGLALGLEGSLVESCLLRPWPGNVRELFAAASQAISVAAAANQPVLQPSHLSVQSGKLASSQPSAFPEAKTPAADAMSREFLEQALRSQNGNISATAKALGLHRTQLYRLLRLHQLLDVASPS